MPLLNVINTHFRKLCTPCLAQVSDVSNNTQKTIQMMLCSTNIQQTKSKTKQTKNLGREKSSAHTITGSRPLKTSFIKQNLKPRQKQHGSIKSRLVS